MMHHGHGMGRLCSMINIAHKVMITPVMSMQCYIVVFDILLPIGNGDTHTFFTCAT
jgi:hypothetical protein